MQLSILFSLSEDLSPFFALSRADHRTVPPDCECIFLCPTCLTGGVSLDLPLRDGVRLLSTDATAPYAAAMAKAQGDYLWFTDSGHPFPDDALSYVLETLDKTTTKPDLFCPIPAESEPGDRSWMLFCALREPCGLQNALFRREFLRAHHIAFPQSREGRPFDFLLRCVAYAETVGWLGRPIAGCPGVDLRREPVLSGKTKRELCRMYIRAGCWAAEWSRFFRARYEVTGRSGDRRIGQEMALFVFAARRSCAFLGERSAEFDAFCWTADEIYTAEREYIDRRMSAILGEENWRQREEE